MASALRQPHWENLRASLDAELALSKQELASDFLELWQTEGCAALKEHFAKQYRRLVGVDPAQHDDFKEALETIRNTGEMTVAELVALFGKR